MAQSIEENKAIVRRWVNEVFNEHRLDSVEHLKVGGYIDWNPYPNQQSALAGFKSVLKSFFEAFPDFHYEVAEELGESDTIVCIGTWKGTHTGHLMNLAPTGKTVSGRRIDVVRISGDKMTERWGTGNELRMLELLGFGGSSPQAGAADSKAVARRFIEEVLNQRSLVAVEQLVGDEAVQDPKETMAMFIVFAACPDARLSVDKLTTQGDKVTALLTFTGTQQNEFMGIAPSGRRFAVEVTLALTVRDGRIAQSRCKFDLDDVARQLKALAPV